MENRNSNVVSKEAPQPQVFNVRGKRVVLDREVAALVGMPTGRLNEPYRRNKHLFTEEMIFQLSSDEFSGLKTQIAFSNEGARGGSRHLPLVYTEEGVNMLERVLKREIKIEFGEEAAEAEVLPESSSESTVMLYQPNENIKIEVRVDKETVWLTKEQLAQLLGTTTQNITIHIGNIYEEKEVEERATCKDFLQVQTEGGREVKRIVKCYNLDIVISLGYRVKSIQGTRFRQWANKVLRGVLLKDHYNDSRIDAHERKFVEIDNRLDKIEEKVDSLIETSIPKKYGIFSGDTVYDAHMFVSSLVEKAKQKIILIDPYIDSSVLTLLTKREPVVNVTIYFDRNKLHNPEAFNQDLVLHNKQYPSVSMFHIDKLHDRFLIIDDEVYHFGASIKDLGNKMFCCDLIPFNAQEVLQKIGVKQ